MHDNVNAAGLCNSCAHQRIITSGRGSVFSLCRRAAELPELPRYPRLPVLACIGYESRSPEGSDPASPES